MYKLIPLTLGLFSKVDTEDYERLKCYNWQATGIENYYYGIRKVSKGKHIKIHREIMGVLDRKLYVDHINGDTLDNRKENLRVCTPEQNQFNRKKQKGNYTSIYKGVIWNKINLNWNARISCKGKRIHLGVFDNEKGAAKAYNEAAIKYFGEFAKLNVVKGKLNV